MPIRPLLTNDVIVVKMNAKTDSSSKVIVAICYSPRGKQQCDDRFRY
jgi:hypothetical protein